MGYCVINAYDTKPKIHFRGWFIWEYFVTFWPVSKRVRGFEMLVIKTEKGEVGSKIADFSATLFLNGSLSNEFDQICRIKHIWS